MSFIQVKNVNKLYATKPSLSDNYALDIINFDIKQGEFFCILGPSGCGKTTLLNILAGFEDPTNGKVILDGVETKGPSPKNVMVFQDHGLLPWRNVWGNVEFPLEFTNLSNGEKKERVKEVLELVGLSGATAKMPRELSGGMRQRVAIARSLVVQPEVLFMDEPFASLDEITRIKLERELLKIWEKKKITIVFITHHIVSALTLADRVAVMRGKPGHIEKIFKVPLPRPRDIDSPALISLKKEMLREMDDGEGIAI